MKLILSLFLLTLSFSTMADIQAKLERDKASCSEDAGKVAWWLLGVNPTWRMSYNECLRSRLNAVAKKSNLLALQQIKLEEECSLNGYNVSTNAHMNLSMNVVHILNKASDTHMQKQRTSMDILGNLESYYKKIQESEKEIRKLKKIKKQN